MLDRRLAALGRRQVAMRLRVGELLSALDGRYHDLGFSTFGGYVRERLSRSAGWARDSRVVARRALERPVLREAFVSGRVSWSMLELLLRHTDAEHEEASADGELLESVDGLSVRELRQVLRARAQDEGREGLDETHDEEVTRPKVLHLTMPREDALALAEAEALVRHLDGTGPAGTGLDDIWLEPLLAEGMSTLLNFMRSDEPVLSESMAEGFALRRRSLEASEAARSRKEARAERALGLGAASACDGESSNELFRSELPASPHAIDAELRAMCRELDAADLAFGALAARFWDASHWRALGYASDTQYARERLGMSRASVWQRMALARRVRGRSALAGALAAGRVGFEAACLVSRVTSTLDRVVSNAGEQKREAVEAAWLARAQQRTFKHLRQEVWAVELLARLEGRALAAGPPTPAELERVWAMERHAKSGESAREAAMRVAELPHAEAVVQMSVTLPAQLASRLELAVAAQQPAATHLGCTTSKLKLSEDVALFFRQLELAHAHSGLPGRFVPFLVSALFHSWRQVLGDRNRWEAIHRRDRYECSCPVCERQDVTLHHLSYRSHGGGDDAANLVSLCSFCHLEGEHGGRLRVRGSAHDPTWTLGPSAAPVLVVRGRERRAH
ncbi:MAG: HNH endonuclease [Deltaproteobacteria bacterium]|nr:HNH endonuclease [Deltaproteobacteria bacterium]